jgi:hypothetical protein
MAPNRPIRSARVLSLLILGQSVQVICGDDSLVTVILANYGSLVAKPGGRVPDLQYVVTGNAERNEFSLARRGQPVIAAPDIGRLLFHLEKDVTVALQERRPDLLFLHAAALEHGGKAYLLAGESGNGKSTTTWGLLHHGFRYLSDELSPIDLNSLNVLPYPHALCLKQPPPSAYPLAAAEVLAFGDTIHVPVLPALAAPGPCELGAVLFVRYREELRAPLLRALGAAEASARMYVITLNALAHPSHGLDAVMHIAERVPCFSLDSSDLRGTCDMVSRMVVAQGLEYRQAGKRRRA